MFKSKTTMNSMKNFIWVILFIISSPAIATSDLILTPVELLGDRGLEIRYIKMDVRDKKDLPKEIKIDGITFPLFESKEDAYNTTIKASIKRDITIVYVISAIEKDKEIISLEK